MSIENMDTEHTNTLESLENLVAANSSTMNALTTEIESLKNSSGKQMFLEDTNGIKVGNLIEGEQGGEEGIFELESVKMIISIGDIPRGIISSEGGSRSIVFIEENCQGNEYSSVGNELVYSRMAENGVMVSYNDSDNTVQYISKESEIIRAISKSYYIDNGECYNKENPEYYSNLAIVSSIEMPEELEVKCNTKEYNDYKHCELYLSNQFKAPFFLNK